MLLYIHNSRYHIRNREKPKSQQLRLGQIWFFREFLSAHLFLHLFDCKHSNTMRLAYGARQRNPVQRFLDRIIHSLFLPPVPSRRSELGLVNVLTHIHIHEPELLVYSTFRTLVPNLTSRYSISTHPHISQNRHRCTRTTTTTRNVCVAIRAA